MTTTQIKIDALLAELERKMADVKDYKFKIKKSMEEQIKYQSGTELRKNETAELKKDLDNLKNSIPDFNQETCEKYLKYHEMKTDYKKLVKFYQKIDDRIKNSEEDINLYKKCISEAETRIAYLKQTLEKTKLEKE